MPYFGMPEWMLPRWTVASGNSHSSKEDRDASYNSLLDRLLSPSKFKAQSMMLSVNNLVLLESLRAFTVNPTAAQGTAAELAGLEPGRGAGEI